MLASELSAQLSGHLPASQPKKKAGNIRRLEAKMMGMTPEAFSRIGRNERCPPMTRRPRTCLADWIGMRRVAWVIAMTPRMTATNRAASRMRRSMPTSEPRLRSNEPSLNAGLRNWAPMAGIWATMPAMIRRLMPLPMPYYSSICSPSHIRNTVPAVMIMASTKMYQVPPIPSRKILGPSVWGSMVTQKILWMKQRTTVA